MTNKSMGTISTTNWFSTTPITRSARSEEERGHGRWKGVGRSALPVGPLAAQEWGMEAGAGGRAAVGGRARWGGARRSQGGVGVGRRGGRKRTAVKNMMGLVIKESGNGFGAVRSTSELPAYAGTSGDRDFRRDPGLPAVETSDECRDFRCKETEKHLNLHSLYHVG